MSQTEYRSRFAVAIAGQADGLGQGQHEAYINDAGFSSEIWTITTPVTPADNTLYSISIFDLDRVAPGFTASFTTGVSTSRAALALGLFNAIRANIQFNGMVSVVNNTSTLVLTHRTRNKVMFPSVGGGGAAPLTIPASPTTAAAAPSIIPFGVGVTRIAGGGSNVRGNKSVRLPLSGDALNAIAGFTILSNNVQKDRVGENALVGYEPGVIAVNVTQRCNNMPGLWIQTAETVVSQDADPVFLSVATTSRGWVQKSSANSAIDISTRARFRSNVQTDLNGLRVVLVQFDF